MKILRFIFTGFILTELAVSWNATGVNAESYTTQDQQNKEILKDGLMGAGVGAIAAGASGGSAGKGALIGAGTNVIGGALIDTLAGSANQQPQPQVQYVQPAPERGYAVVDSPSRNGGCGRRAQ